MHMVHIQMFKWNSVLSAVAATGNKFLNYQTKILKTHEIAGSRITGSKEQIKPSESNVILQNII